MILISNNLDFINLKLNRNKLFLGKCCFKDKISMNNQSKFENNI